MDKKYVVVTGASGYIGKHVVKALLDKGHEVTAVDLRFKDIDPRARKQELSIFENDKQVFQKLGSPDVVIHLAWRDGFFHNSHNHLLDLSAHFQFISNLLEGGLKHIVVMGSMHEVGYWEGAVNDDTPTNPLSYYGIAKNTLRTSVALLSKEYDAVYQWLRAYYVTGDDLENNSIFSKLIQKENEGATYFPFTSGKNKYDFIEVDDLARQIVAVAVQEKINGVINCCSGKPISLGEKVESFINEKNFKIKLQYGKFPDRPYDSPAIWGDATKIQEILKHEKE